MDYNFTSVEVLSGQMVEVLVYRSPIQGTYGKWMVWLIVFYVWKCLEKIMPSLRLLHKLSPNWPRAGNSSGSISDQALLAAWIYSLFGKVKVIYKHYQKPFPMQPWLRVLLERSKIHSVWKSVKKVSILLETLSHCKKSQFCVPWDLTTSKYP